MRIKNWERFQHFKDRKPLWIKVYLDLLDNIEWHELDGTTAKVLVMIWLLGAEKKGELPDTKKIAFRLRLSEKVVLQHVVKLDDWLIQSDNGVISDGYHSDALETEKRREEKETEKEKKTAHGELGKVMLTEDEYKKLQSKHDPEDLSRAIEILDGYIATKNPKYASHYAVFKEDSWLWERLAEKTGQQPGDQPPKPTTRHQLNLQLQALDSMWEQHKSKDTWRGKEAQAVKDKMKEVKRQLAFAK